jgi:hypothetical protein
VGLAGALFKDHREPVEVGSDIVFHLVREVSAAAKSADPVQVVIGVLFIAGAQIFTASQFVLEEWILENYALAPLKVVGWEGIFGTTVTFIGMIILHLAIGRTESGRYGYFDAAEGLRNMMNVPAVAKSSLLIMISIGYAIFLLLILLSALAYLYMADSSSSFRGFNFFGLSVTRTVSATSRSTIDTSRTLFIWLVSLGLGWETFKWLQVVGFAMLVYGTFLFNGIIAPPLKACLPPSPRDPLAELESSRSRLLPEEPIEHM